MAQVTQEASTTSDSHTATTRQPAAWRRGAALAVVTVLVYWGVYGLSMAVELPYFFRFLFGMAAPFLFLLAFTFWWWSRAGLTWTERIVGFLVVVLSPAITAPLTHKSLGLVQMLMMGLPVSMSVWMLWTLHAQKHSLSGATRRLGAIALLALSCGVMTLWRMDGLDGDLHAGFHWRWTPTAEEQFLASQAKKSPAVEPNAADDLEIVALSAGDWPRFRGPNGDGVVHDVVISQDWEKQPPRQVWRQRIGPAWSSMSLVGNRLFTQEQRGEQEVVSCYDANTGEQLWAHEDTARFWEAVSGIGPRGTPTFADGRLYTLGATGIFNCLDPASGRLLWSHDLQKDAHAKVPMWGMSSSPLVIDSMVVVYGGGDGDDDLLAYDIASGSRLWQASAGTGSYASPQLVKIGDSQQILMHCDDGLFGFDLSGKPLWQGGEAMPGAPRNLQAHVIAGAQILAGTLNGIGVGLADIGLADSKWGTTGRWKSTDMKPEFSELVVHDGHAYGFDGALLCCLDLESGKRTWKKGRYGRGQVLLLPEQSQLLVLTESGEVVLVAARADRHEELGRFQAISGKTWNHPVLAQGKLWVRNAEEIACYELAQPAPSVRIDAP